MANNRVCKPCSEGRYRDCYGRWQAPSNRGELSGGNMPKQQIFTYRCPVQGQPPKP